MDTYPFEDTLIRVPAVPSLERPRLYVDGEPIPALYHYAVRAGGVELIVPAQHEIDAAQAALAQGEALKRDAAEAGSVLVCGVDERGQLGEYPIRIQVGEDGVITPLAPPHADA